MHIVIIGNGITGVTTARHIRKLSDHDITIVSGETDHFFSRTALMYVYMGHMRYKDTKPYEDYFWSKNRINLKKAWIESVDTDKKNLCTSTGETISYDKLVIASGSKSNDFWGGALKIPGALGLYSYQDLEQLETLTSKPVNRAVIIGGGLIGIELAEMLHSRHIPVTFLVRESLYWDNVLPEGEARMVTNHIREYGFELRLEEEMERILMDENGNARAVVTKKGDEITCQIIGLTAGVSPNIDFLKESNIETQRGVMVNLALETNETDVYAAGDCAQFHEPQSGRRSIEQVWYTGKIMGQALASTICDNRTEYDPGPWYNSAKFLDIEYQTYGMVMPQLREGEKSLYWEHENGKQCAHFVYHEITKELIGINTLGIRLRHLVFDKWLREKRAMEYVLKHLKTANFDPEFFTEYEQGVIDIYNNQEGSQLTTSTQRGLKSVLQLFKA